MIKLTDLQKKEKKLENEINFKLVSLDTLVAEKRHAKYNCKSKNINSYNSSFNSILVEIEEPLSELDVVNAKLGETASVEEDDELKWINILQRREQVVDDLGQDLTKIRENYVVRREQGSENMSVVQSSSGQLETETAVNIREGVMSQRRRYSLKQVKVRLADVQMRFNCYKCWNLMFLALVTSGCISFMLLYTSW